MLASLVTLKGQRGYPFGSEEDFAAMMTMSQILFFVENVYFADVTSGVDR